jgi:hypothetical protein
MLTNLLTLVEYDESNAMKPNHNVENVLPVNDSANTQRNYHLDLEALDPLLF